MPFFQLARFAFPPDQNKSRSHRPKHPPDEVLFAIQLQFPLEEYKQKSVPQNQPTTRTAPSISFPPRLAAPQPDALLLNLPRLQERPRDTVEAANAERRELLERRRREVQAADRAARAGVCDGDDDGFVAVGDAHLATAHGVPAIGQRSTV